MSVDRRAFNPYFEAEGKTVKVAGATTAPTGVAVLSKGSGQYRVYNDGSVTAFLGYGVDAATAQTNTVIPTGSGSNSKKTVPLPAGAIEILSAPPDSFFSAITGTSTADIYVTPGAGV